MLRLFRKPLFIVNFLRNTLLVSGLAFCTFSAAQEDASSLSSLGFAKYSELGDDLYIGALFVEQSTSDVERIKAMGQKRIEIKIIAEKLSYRRFKRQLAKSAAINNPQDLLISHTNAFEEFLTWFKENLAYGDHIVISLNDGKVELLVNDISLANISSPELFNILLNTWVGEMPPSREFKMQVLGLDTDEGTQAEFESLNYIADRVEIISDWKKKKVEPVSQRQAMAARLAAEAGQVASQTEDSLQGLAEREKESLVLITREDNEEPPAGLTIDTPSLTATAPVIVAADLDEAERDQIAGDGERVVVEAANTVAAEQEPSDPEMAEQLALLERAAAEKRRQEENEKLAALQLLQDQFTSELLVHSRSNMRYPPHALRLGQEDTIMASVTIDRQGKLVEFELTSESKFSLLNSEVKKGIKRSIPFPRIPAEIEGEAYTFELPVIFHFDKP